MGGSSMRGSFPQPASECQAESRRGPTLQSDWRRRLRSKAITKLTIIGEEGHSYGGWKTGSSDLRGVSMFDMMRTPPAAPVVMGIFVRALARRNR